MIVYIYIYIYIRCVYNIFLAMWTLLVMYKNEFIVGLYQDVVMLVKNLNAL